MLVLTLEMGEWVRIGNVRVQFERKKWSGGGVRVVIDAPPEVRVLRESLVEISDEAQPVKS